MPLYCPDETGEANEVRTIYVGKHGSDASSGLNIENAKLTIGAALTAAAALTPSAVAPVVVNVQDAGIYAENITTQSWVTIHAPSATIEGLITLVDDSSLVLDTATRSGAGNILLKVAGTGTANVRLRNLTVPASAFGCINTSGVVMLQAETIDVSTGGFGVGDISSALGHVHVEAEDIYVDGATGIARFGAGTTVARIAHIIETGAASTGINTAGGELNAFVGKLDTTTTYAVGGGAELNLVVGELVGTPGVVTGTANILEPGTVAVGPGASTDEALVRWDGTSGNLTQDSGWLLDDSDVLTGSGNLLIDADAAHDIGDSTNAWRTLYLSNAGGDIIKVPGALAQGASTDYTMMLGGGFYAPALGGGTFTFEFESAVAGGENLLVFDMGAVYFSGGPTFSNDFIIKCNNGLDTHRFIAKFGGWTNPEYGWALDRVTGTAENAGKTLFFDNQEPVSDSLRSIDFRINSVNILTIENNQTVNFPLRKVTAPTGLIINGFASLTSSTVFNLYDILTVAPVNTNAGGILSLKPAGTSTTAATLVTNAVSTSDYGTLENSLGGTIARLATWRLATGSGPTEFRIGEMTSAFFGVGICDALTTIDFYFANAIECRIQKDTLVFNNGATDTQLDWGTNGQLGLQVATNDILRLTATQIQAIQDIVVSDAQNIVLNTTTGTQIATATNQKLGFWGATPVVRPAAYTPTNVATDRAYDANATTVNELADVLGTLIADLQSIGVIG